VQKAMRTCPNCGTAHDRQGKYCRDACRQESYRKRNGIAKPAFLNSKRHQSFLMPEEERELRLLDIEIEALDSIVREQDEAYKETYRASFSSDLAIDVELPTLLDDQSYHYSDAEAKNTQTGETITIRDIFYTKYRFTSSEQLKQHLAKPACVHAFKEPSVRRRGCEDNAHQALQSLKSMEAKRNRLESLESKLLVQKKRRRYQLVRSAETRIERKSEGGISGADLVKKRFTNLPFDGKWKELLGCPTPGFYGIVWGDAKSGKSFFTVELAQYLTNTKFLSGKVAYMSFEEGVEQTIQAKVLEKQAYDITIFDCTSAQQMEKFLESGFNFVVVDSATKADIDSAFMEELRLKHPQTAFIVILQTVKGGKNFKGEQDWKHHAQFIVTVERIEKGKKEISCFGRFGQGTITEEFQV
jgi:hypothetical protein